jgi:hypothetical protein
MQIVGAIAPAEAGRAPAPVAGISDRASVEAVRRLVGRGAAASPGQVRPGEAEAVRRAG